MILAIDTSTPECKMFLIRNNSVFADKNWLAERRLALELLEQLETFLAENESSFKDIKGLVIFRGPGSFTGLRIGITVFNTLAEGLNIPIVGELGDDWLKQGIGRLSEGKVDTIVLPEYGMPPHITQPKK